MPKYEQLRLDRTEIVVCPMPQVESVSVGLWFHAGSRFEDDALNGAAHFLEHMLFKGTKKRSARQITEVIESKGGDLNAFTAEEMACYYARTSAEHLELVVDVLFDMLWHSTFPAAEVERERGVIQEEIRMYDDQPHSVAGEALNRNLWPGNALGSPITGTEKSVRELKRAELMSFWRSRYQPQHLVVSIAGKVDPEGLPALLAPHLGRSHPSRSAGAWTPVRIPQRRRMGVRAVARPVQQANLAIGLRTVSRRDPRRYMLKLLSIILGENMSSRLFQTVREKHGLAYSVHSSTQHFNDAGALYVQAGLDPENLGKAAALIARELARLKERTVSAAELRRAKDYAIGQMKLAMESTSNQMMWMGESMMGINRILDPAEVERALRAVTVDEVGRMAEETFRPGCMEAVCVGPGLEPAGLEEALDPLQRI